jgi:alpha-glucosidase
MRAHSVINEKNKEPWEYGDEFTSINRETINLRYRLLPYIYTTMYQASETGIPAMRPMMLVFPNDDALLRNEDQFMFGDWLLVAPILEQDGRTRSVQLPNGVWYDYWSGTRYAGNKRIAINAPLNRIPIFAKAGAIIPTQQVVQYTDQSSIDPLTLTVYPAELKSMTTYYEDDGFSFAYAKGRYFKRSIGQWISSESTTLTLSKAEGTYSLSKRNLIVRFVDAGFQPKEVTVSGKQYPKIGASELVLAKRGWSYDENAGVIVVKAEDSADEIVVRVKR